MPKVFNLVKTGLRFICRPRQGRADGKWLMITDGTEQGGNKRLFQNFLWSTIVVGLLVGAFFIFNGNEDNASPTITEEVVKAKLDCGDGPLGVWSVGTPATGVTCARVTNKSGNELSILKGEDYVHAQVSGLSPNAPYSFLVRTKKDLLFRVAGEADIKGNLLMDLSASISPRVMDRLLRDKVLSFLPRDKGSHQDVIRFPLKGSGKALKLF